MDLASSLCAFLISVAVSPILSAGAAQCTTSQYPCSNGACLPKRVQCDGFCDCVNCDEESRCNSATYRQYSGDWSTGMGARAVVGIVIAAVSCFVLIATVIVKYCLYRYRGTNFFKRSRPQIVDDDLDPRTLGLSMNIPAEAVARVPPPRYTPRVDLEYENSGTNQSAAGGGNASLSMLPPPYYTTRAVLQPGSTFDGSYDEPPSYRSRVNGDSSLVGTGVEVRHDPGRQFNQSMDSFMDYPSMSDILLTSSRSSLPTSPASSSGQRGEGRGMRNSQLTDSARGDSLSSDNHSNELVAVPSKLKERDRSSSMADVVGAAACLIPEGGLRRKVAERGAAEKVKRDPVNRSTPSVFSDAELAYCKRTSLNQSSATESVDYDDSVSGLSPTELRKKSKRGGMSDDASEGRRTSVGGRKKIKRGVGSREESHSLPQLATLDEETRWESQGGLEGEGHLDLAGSVV